MTKRYSRLCVAAALISALGLSGEASAYVVSGTSGSYDVSADFEVVGSQLQVTLLNSSSLDVMNPAQVLTALAFDMSGATLSNGHAALDTVSNSQFVYTPSGVTPDLDSGWGYGTNASGWNPPNGQHNAIAASGLLSGLGHAFDGSTALGGVAYGITSKDDDLSTGNICTDITSPSCHGPLEQYGVVFTFDLTTPPGGTFDPMNDISNVAFLFGTALGEGCIGQCRSVPQIPPPPGDIPEPASMLFLGLGALGLGLIRRRKMAAG